MNIVKEKLQAGRVTLGSWVMISDAGSAELLALSGFDWVTIDMEHTSISYETAEDMIRAIERHNVVPLVRVAADDPVIIKRCLDVGAGGIIVPMIKTADQARRIVSEAKYPPEGVRGASFSRATMYGEDFARYYGGWNDDVIVVAMIEHIDAVNNIDQIVETVGLDALFFGPYDLSSSMGIVGQLDHPDFVAAIDKVKQAAAKVRLPVGIHVVFPNVEDIRARAEQGFQLIACSLDSQMILHLAKQLASALDESASQE